MRLKKRGRTELDVRDLRLRRHSEETVVSESDGKLERVDLVLLLRVQERNRLLKLSRKYEHLEPKDRSFAPRVKVALAKLGNEPTHVPEGVPLSSSALGLDGLLGRVLSEEGKLKPEPVLSRSGHANVLAHVDPAQ